MFCRAEGAANEPVAGSVHGIRRASLVFLGRDFCRGVKRVDPHKAHHRHALHADPAVHKFVPDIFDGAAQPGAQQRTRKINGRVHRTVRVHHGHQSAGGHGQVLELPQIRTERGDRTRTVRHRYAGTVGFHESHIVVRHGRKSSVHENVRPVRHRPQQIVRHTGRSGQQEGKSVVCYSPV